MKLTKGEVFYRGFIRNPDGAGVRVIVKKATRALAERMAMKAANDLSWNWYVERCRVDVEGDDLFITVVDVWSAEQREVAC